MTRSNIEYKDISERYILEEEDYKDCFQRQYFHIYTTRLEQLKSRVLAAAEHEIGKDPWHRRYKSGNFRKGQIQISTVGGRTQGRGNLRDRNYREANQSEAQHS